MNYKYEFWSEIIAYQLGNLLGFDVLPYYIAKREGVIGCISKSMISEEEELVEGGKYLQAVDPKFKPEDTSQRNRYNSQLIVDSLDYFSLDKFTAQIIDMIVFDALIGNSDRHQENWAMITNQTELSKAIRDFNDENANSTFLGRLFKKALQKKEVFKKNIEGANLYFSNKPRFAPIYDSGCCFGRELEDNKVKSMLTNKDQMQAYVDRGKAEIHWYGKKISHFELIKKLVETLAYKEMVISALSKVVLKFDETKFQNIIFSIDDPLDKIGLGRHLPEKRKKMIIELLLLRYHKLRDLYLNNK